MTHKPAAGLFQSFPQGGGCLVKSGLSFQSQDANSFQQAQGSHAIDISTLFLKGCRKKQENFQFIANSNILVPKNVITLIIMKDSQCDFVFFVCFVYFVVKYVWVAGVKPALAVYSGVSNETATWLMAPRL